MQNRPLYPICATLIIASFFLSHGASASDLGCDKKEYTCYQSWVESFCKSPSKPWNIDNKNLGSIENRYAELSPSAQNKKIQDIINREKYPSERAKLEQELNLDRIGTFQGFKAVEIARIEYRNNMNKIFSCAVIASRIEKTKKIQELIAESGTSEITEKLKADIRKLEQLKPTSCATNMNTSRLNDYGRSLASSAAAEYCSYRNYLDYLKENIDTNYSDILEKEKQIGNSIPGSTLSTIETVSQSMNLRSSQIQEDILRAQSTLPKALVAYREMERTYTLHLMYVIIFDDYLKLRQNMNTYLNAVSQLFEKAKNAQSANNR